jgi:phosphohistidine swiveling domain-containing protein
LAFTKEQKHDLAAALEKFPPDTLFAIRSSSPEEDLEGSSFAGGYETVLGVTHTAIHDAIRKAFASCLDYRVAVYKKENGFKITDPKIAVIVQEQIASEIAGVGFSLNPVTNNYDEAVFNANWGLGETVVSGTATPDTFIVNKDSLEIKSVEVGGKELTLWLTPNGGTTEKHNFKSDKRTLTDEEVTELSKLVVKVEELYQKPIDIEWAFAKTKLYLLQARPITSYVPLPLEMITKPGEKKRLYLDVTISVQGLYKPMSPMGTSVLAAFFKKASTAVFSKDITADTNSSPIVIRNGRIYANLSNLMAIAGKKKIGSFLTNMDSLASKTVLAVSEDEYVSENKDVKHLPMLLAKKMPTFLPRILKTRMFPMQVHERTQLELYRFEEEAAKLEKENLPLRLYRDTLFKLVINVVFKNCIPILLSSRVALHEMKQIAGDTPENELSQLEFSLPNNVTTDMGLSLADIAKLLPNGLTKEELQNDIKHKKLSADFFEAWDTFLRNYGHRGPIELDIASPRYRDNPQLLYELLLSMSSANSDENPQEAFEKNKLKRRETYQRLYKQIRAKNWLKAQQFRFLYRTVENLAGYRETPKFYLIYAIDKVRQKILIEAQQLYKERRLDSIEQVFDLTFDELEQGLLDKELNLKEISIKNRSITDRLNRVPQLPTIINSRGLILRPPAQPLQKNAVSGMAVSAGIIKGRIKILHTPDEKPLLKGEILVARATDPGWTPLFVNAGAVILEVGGLLQHGALVAREYGLPCVAGIENATNLWKDGMLVEVDGSAGIVRTITDTT